MVSCLALLLVPVATGPATGALLLGLAFFLRGLGLTGWNVQIETLQQAIVPRDLLGRMNASYLLLSFGAGSVGALLGGRLGSGLGLRPTLLLGAAGISMAWLWLLASPLRRLRALPAPAEEIATSGERAGGDAGPGRPVPAARPNGGTADETS